MELYSGQGRITLAKYDNNGELGPRFFFGNVPLFSVNFQTGEIKLKIDELRDESLEILCGSPAQQVDGGLQFEIGKGIASKFKLTFDGVNTAMNNRRWRVELPQVTLGPATNWEFIGEEFVTISLSGLAHENASGSRGTVYRQHQESTTGDRLTDMQQVVSQ